MLVRAWSAVAVLCVALAGCDDERSAAMEDAGGGAAEPPPALAGEASAGDRTWRPDVDADPDTPLREAPASALVAMLGDEEASVTALHELLRRRAPDAWPSFPAFVTRRAALEVIRCPQPGGGEPVSLVLYGFAPPQSRFPASDEQRLFGPRPLASSWSKQVVAFTASGQEVRLAPRSDHHIPGDALVDLRGDGGVDRISAHSPGVWNARVLLASRVVAPAFEPWFAVVYGWEEADGWGFHIERPVDGLPEVQLGPVDASGVMQPAVTYRWSASEGRMLGPAGSSGDHFRVIEATQLWRELRRLAAEGTRFPRSGASSADRRRAQAHARRRAAEAVGSGDGAGVAFEGRVTARGDRIPAGLATLPPKHAALRLVEANRSEEHRRSLLVALDDLEAPAPPVSGVVTFAHRSSGCYTLVERRVLLHFAPSGSYLAYGRRTTPSVVHRSLGADPTPQYGFLRLPLRYEDARWMAHLLTWLARVRTQEQRRAWWGMHSTADGQATLALLPDAGAGLEVSGRAWGGSSIPRRWEAHGHFGPSALLAFAELALLEVLPDRLGARWPAPADTPEAVAAALAEARSGAPDAALELAAQAAEAAGLLGHAELLPALRALALRIEGLDGDAAEELRAALTAAVDRLEEQPAE